MVSYRRRNPRISEMEREADEKVQHNGVSRCNPVTIGDYLLAAILGIEIATFLVVVKFPRKPR